MVQLKLSLLSAHHILTHMRGDAVYATANVSGGEQPAQSISLAGACGLLTNHAQPTMSLAESVCLSSRRQSCSDLTVAPMPCIDRLGGKSGCVGRPPQSCCHVCQLPDGAHVLGQGRAVHHRAASGRDTWGIHRGGPCPCLPTFCLGRTSLSIQPLSEQACKHRDERMPRLRTEGRGAHASW